MEQSPLFWIFNIAVVLVASALTIYSARKRKGAGGYLCEDCRFNSPRDCLKSVRPFALVCTSYRQINDVHELVASAPIAITTAANTVVTSSTVSVAQSSAMSTTTSPALPTTESVESKAPPASTTSAPRSTGTPSQEEDK